MELQKGLVIDPEALRESIRALQVEIDQRQTELARMRRQLSACEQLLVAHDVPLHPDAAEHALPAPTPAGPQPPAMSQPAPTPAGSTIADRIMFVLERDGSAMTPSEIVLALAALGTPVEGSAPVATVSSTLSRDRRFARSPLTRGAWTLSHRELVKRADLLLGGSSDFVLGAAEASAAASPTARMLDAVARARRGMPGRAQAALDALSLTSEGEPET